MFETIETRGNIEYFIRADGKKAMRNADESIGYRIDEMKPELQEVLDRARAMYNYPYRCTIDKALEYQKHSVLKAVRYIQWRMLGECNYLDVYGAQAEAEFSRHRQQQLLESSNERINELNEKIDKLQGKINYLIDLVEDDHGKRLKFQTKKEEYYLAIVK